MDAATRMRSNGGKARAAKRSKEEIAQWGRNGGTARAAKLTPAQRKAAARKAAAARWGLAKQKKRVRARVRRAA